MIVPERPRLVRRATLNRWSTPSQCFAPSFVFEMFGPAFAELFQVLEFQSPFSARMESSGLSKERISKNVEVHGYCFCKIEREDPICIRCALERFYRQRLPTKRKRQ